MDAVQQANSGHPEYRWNSGVETTTGPLGQGVATSVGMPSRGAGSRRAATRWRVLPYFK